MQARFRAMDKIIEELLVDAEKKSQQEEQKNFKETDTAIDNAIKRVYIELYTIELKLSADVLIPALKEKIEFLKKLRKLILTIREDELRLLTVYFDQGVRDREQQQKKLLGKVTLLKRVRDKFLNLGDEVIQSTGREYIPNSAHYSDRFAALLQELAIIARHRRYAYKSLLLNLSVFVGCIALGTIIAPGIGTLFGFCVGSLFVTRGDESRITGYNFLLMGQSVFMRSKSSFSEKTREAYTTSLYCRELYVLADPVVTPAASAVETKSSVRADSVNMYRSKSLPASFINRENLSAPSRVDASMFKSINGYDQYRQYIAEHETAEVIANTRRK